MTLDKQILYLEKEINEAKKLIYFSWWKKHLAFMETVLISLNKLKELEK